MSEAHSNISISEAIADPPTFCAKCHTPEEEARLLQCARCKLARYCCRACQREHFTLHKKGCKRIAGIREQLANDESDDDSRADTLILLGDTLVEVTYRSCHSLDFSMDGLASAVKYYMEVMQYPNTRPQYTKVIFLLAAIGHDDAAVSVIYYDTIHSDTMPDVIPRIDQHDDILALVPSGTEWNATNLVTLLFIKMKLVANGSNNDTQQRAQMNDVRGRIGPHLLDAIQHTIPLSPASAPILFDDQTPFEFWCLLQDCFFMTPGVNQLLFEDDNDA